VLGACVEAVGTKGVRTIPLRDFFTGVKKTALAADEIVVSLRIPERADVKTAFLKQQRIRGHDLAVVNVAGSFSPSERILQLAIGSCAPTPVLLEPIEVDSRDLAAFSSHVTKIVHSSVSPISDVRASADYRNAILPVLVKRILQSLLAEGGAS